MLAEERPVAEYFEAVVAARPAGVEPKTVANWVTGELFRLLNAAGVGIEAVKITPARLRRAAGAGEPRGRLNLNSAKKVFGVMFETGRRAPEIVRELGLAQVSDADALADAVHQALAQYPAEVARYRARRGEAVRLADGSGDAGDQGQGQSGGGARAAGGCAEKLTKDEGRTTLG